METILSLLMLCAAPVFLAIFAMGVAHGHGRSELEDTAQYEHFNPTVKPIREVDRKTPTPVQTTDTSETVAKSSEKAAASSLTETTYVHSVMQRQPCYCFENQSMDEVRKIMRERHLPFLVVLDNYMRIVGTVTMGDLNQNPSAQDPPQGGE